jgi:hypothetical protein
MRDNFWPKLKTPQVAKNQVLQKVRLEKATLLLAASKNTMDILKIGEILSSLLTKSGVK